MTLITSINKSYIDSSNFEKLNIDLKPGELYIITGKNGAGKSTLLKILAGLVKAKIKKTGKLNKKIGYVPDKVVFPKSFIVSKFLSIISSNNNEYDYVEEMNEWNLIDGNVSNYSKGMKQKVAIIQSYISNQKYIIYDEPLNGLDEKSVDFFIKKIDILLKERKCIVLVTHQEKLFNRIKYKHIRLND